MMGLTMDNGLPLVSELQKLGNQGSAIIHPQSHPIYKMYKEFKDGDGSEDR